VGAARWRASQARAAKPVSEAYFDNKFPIERALTRALLHHKKTGKYTELDTLTNTGFYELYSFASTLVRVY
jgi:hypothetical protein